MAANMNLTIFINVLFAGIIAFGVVYNAARVSLSERSHELASLRVLGFTRAEISLILMGELALLTLVGAAGRRAASATAWRLPSCSTLAERGVPVSALRLAARRSRGRFSGSSARRWCRRCIVRRRLDRLDLVAVLKVRE